MTARHLGEEGFRWFVGVVEDRDDPKKLGRVRVRIYNVHSTKSTRASTEDFPWATVLNPVTSASFNRIGTSPTGILVGSTVIGFFMDNKDGNYPVIMGTIAGIPGDDVNNHDVPSEAREVNSIVKEPIGPEPTSAYQSKYPYNKVIRTEGGHVIEIDDSPEHERIHIYHKSGTYTEINNEGRLVTKVVNDNIEVVVKNKEVYVEGNVNINVKGNVTMNVDGNMDSTIGGTYSVTSGGNMTFKAPKIDLN